ncbi:MAG TPA: ATP-dependent DNA helicase [Pseudomonadota bacterium]|nr:ATP-dependent DNA helicase [Pseudomonadota bacterium]
MPEVFQSSPAALALGPDGPFAANVPDFAPREVQQRMAAAVEEAIANNEELVVEAGTGTGKTFAYLVPALLSGLRVIVSTGTKTLQDQLFHRDLPRVREVLGARLKAALLKGRANYLCRHRLERTVSEGRLGSRAEVTQLALVRGWATRTKTGDIAELPGVPEDASVWPRVTSTPENCLGAECPCYQDCFVVEARRAAQEADVLVVNHHLLFADLAIKREGFGEILPGANAFVLDEAHQVPELAGQFFSRTVSSRQLVELEQDALREAAAESGAKAALAALGTPIEPAVRNLRLALEGDGKRGPWARVRERDAVDRALEALAQALERTTATLATLAERSEGLDSCHARAEDLHARLAELRVAAEPGWVHWYEAFERGFVLASTPLDVAEPLREFRQRTRAAWIFTSATLSVAGRFEHFTAQMGLEDPVTLALPSPFDFPRNALLYVPQGLPPPAASDYVERVVDVVRPVLEHSNGRAFLLFTSHRALRRAAELLADAPWPLFVQGTAPRAQLLDAFRASGNGVLLGAASFWEGVDVRGEALSVVVIDKLPFAPPDDPVLEARLSTIREAGGNPFAEYQVPAAAIALKQGAGRLIRDVHDRGVLVLCDPRLYSAGYGKLFLASLPPMPVTRALADVGAFFAADDGVIELASSPCSLGALT